MKTASLFAFVLFILVSTSAPAAGYSNKALSACASAIKEFHPEVVGPKQVLKRRSGSFGSFEYWINAGSEDTGTRVYCRASKRQGVIALAVESGRWAQGEFSVPRDAAAPTTQQVAGQFAQ